MKLAPFSPEKIETEHTSTTNGDSSSLPHPARDPIPSDEKEDHTIMNSENKGPHPLFPPNTPIHLTQANSIAPESSLPNPTTQISLVKNVTMKRHQKKIRKTHEANPTRTDNLEEILCIAASLESHTLPLRHSSKIPSQHCLGLECNFSRPPTRTFTSRLLFSY